MKKLKKNEIQFQVANNACKIAQRYNSNNIDLLTEQVADIISRRF